MWKKIILALVLVAAGAGGYLFYLQQSAVEAAVGEVIRMDVEQIISETAAVTAGEQVTVPSSGTGTITRLYVEEGQQVNRGDLLLTYDVAASELTIASLQAQQAGLTNKLQLAIAEEQRQAVLLQEGAISQTAYEQYTASREELETQITALDYTIAAARKSNGNGRVTAPMTGVVTQLDLQQGNLIAMGQHVLEISNLEQLYLKANLVAEDAAKIAVGNPVRLLDDDGNILPVTAKVDKIALKAQEVVSALGIVQKRVAVDIALLDGQPALRLGTDVDIQIQTALAPQVLAVPEKAIFEQDGVKKVYVVEDQHARLVTVETGLAGEQYTEIRQGLEQGQQIILSPGNEIEAGVKVKSNAL